MPKMRSKLNTNALEASIEAKKKAGLTDIPADEPMQEIKNKGGRPKSQSTKEHRLYVYLSDDDYKNLKELSSKTGEPMSIAARKAIIYRLRHIEEEY